MKRVYSDNKSKLKKLRIKIIRLITIGVYCQKITNLITKAQNSIPMESEICKV
jgi:hypothetical protein